MVTLRACPAAVGLITVSLLTLLSAHAAVPDYRLGDVAREDVITPVPLLAVNPEATRAMRQTVEEQAPFIVFQTPQSTDEAETELRQSLAKTRAKFLTVLQQIPRDLSTSPTKVDSLPYTDAIAEVARESPLDLPLELLAPFWVRGASDEPVVENLLKPIRKIMTQPIVRNKVETPLPADQPVRLIQLQNLSQTPSVPELERAGVTIPVEQVISLFHARLQVKTAFPLGQENLGRFAATFVRNNAYPDAVLSEVLRVRRMEGVTVNETYVAGQPIVQKGQKITPKVLRALAALREKSVVGTLQAKLEQQQSVAGQITSLTKWIVAGVAALGLGLMLIFWRLRARPGNALVLVQSEAEQRALSESAGESVWRTRALIAEGKAERAQAAIRSGALGWMRGKIFQTLFHQRADLLSVHQRAEAEMHELEQRLEQLHVPLQERIRAYEKRIQELEQELAAKGEENRELLGARITATRQQLALESARSRIGDN